MIELSVQCEDCGQTFDNLWRWIEHVEAEHEDTDT